MIVNELHKLYYEVNVNLISPFNVPTLVSDCTSFPHSSNSQLSVVGMSLSSQQKTQSSVPVINQKKGLARIISRLNFVWLILIQPLRSTTEQDLHFWKTSQLAFSLHSISLLFGFIKS